MEANIPIFETKQKDIFDIIDEDSIVEIVNNDIIHEGGKILANCVLLDENKIEELLNIGYENIEKELESFIENTLEYAKKEKGLVTGKIPPIPKTKN